MRRPYVIRKTRAAVRKDDSTSDRMLVPEAARYGVFDARDDGAHAKHLPQIGSIFKTGCLWRVELDCGAEKSFTTLRVAKEWARNPRRGRLTWDVS